MNLVGLVWLKVDLKKLWFVIEEQSVGLKNFDLVHRQVYKWKCLFQNHFF